MRDEGGSDPVPNETTQVASTQERGEPRRSGRVVRQRSTAPGHL